MKKYRLSPCYSTSEIRKTHKAARDKRKRWINEGWPRGMQYESYRSYKAAKILFTNTQNSSTYYNYQTEVCREIDEYPECDIHIFWKLWKGQNKKEECNILGITD
jgi:hypothetical protein